MTRDERIAMYGPQLIEEFRRVQLLGFPCPVCCLAALLIGVIFRPSTHDLATAAPVYVVIGLLFVAALVFQTRYTIAMNRVRRKMRAKRLAYKMVPRRQG